MLQTAFAAQADEADYDIVTISVTANSYDATKPPTFARVKYNKLCPLVITSDDMGRVEYVRNWAYFNGYPVLASSFFGQLDDPMALLNAPYNSATLAMQEPSLAGETFTPLTYSDGAGGVRRFTATSAIMPYKISSANYTFMNGGMAKAMVRTGWSFAQHDVADKWPNGVTTNEQQQNYIKTQLPLQSQVMEDITGYGLKVMVEPNGNHNYIGASLATQDHSWIIYQNASTDYPAQTKSIDLWTQSEQTTFARKPAGAYERTFFQDGSNNGANDGQGLMDMVNSALQANDGSTILMGGTHGIGNRVLQYLRQTVQPADRLWVAGADEVWEYYHLYNNAVIDNVSYADGKLTFDVKVPRYAKHQFRELTINIPGVANGTDCQFSSNVVTGDAQQNTGQYTINFGLEEGVKTHIDELIGLYRANLTNLYLKRDAQYLIDLLKDGQAKDAYQAQLNAEPAFAYIVKNNLGGELMAGAVDVAVEVNYRFPKYVVSEGTLYEANKNTQTIQGTSHVANYVGAFTPSQAQETVTVNYSETSIGNVTFYSEGEDLSGVTVATEEYRNIENNSGVAYALRYASNGAGGQVLTPVTATTIEPGKYTLVAAIGDTHTSSTAQFTFKVGDKTVLALTTEDVSGYIKEYTKEGIVVKAAQPLTIEAVNSGGSFWLDYLYLVKTGDYDGTVPEVTVAAPSAVVDVTDGVAPVTLTATATGYDGAAIVETVIKDSNGNTLATADGPTCTFVYTPTRIGDVVFTAEATDEQGRSGLSEDFTLTVKSDFTLTARSNLGDDLGSVTFEGQAADRSHRFLFPRFLLRGTVLYETDALNTDNLKLHYGEDITFTMDGRTVERTVDYSPAVANVVFYSEGEGIEGTRTWTNTVIDKGKGETFALTLGSMGACGALTNVTVTTLPAGTYRVVAGIGTTNSANYTFYLGNETLATYTPPIAPAINMFTSDEFTLTAPTALSMYCDKGKDNSQNWLDFIYVQKLDAVKVDVTAVGYATFSSPYALDFCHTAIKAYTATMNATGDKLMMTLVEGPVPAQTGLFLQGTVGKAVSAAVPLATTVPDPVEGNVLVAHVDEGTVEAGNYVFSGTQDVRSLAFRRLSDPVTMPGGRAYLSGASLSASAARIVMAFSDDTAVIGLPEDGGTAATGDTFLLQGFKVGGAVRGLLIRQGKKYIKNK